ncbi:hypothetical protein GGI11_004445 [Coemansia sp. RSA 2049]|nr:hypothetical protein GGI11_004445 [Coemansia sp. RSA 2049]KAJ2515644.1 hypothetical protein H4217_005049 [Coemansia sp. RSA 1939]KAJ2612656.1 hypothetical protein EV177_002883 [Coemansia sp. RSA 1804]KAJ2693320.1 hypothetical protein GGH99_001214 [Coemansia sp. RSA 1285]
MTRELLKRKAPLSDYGSKKGKGIDAYFNTNKVTRPGPERGRQVVRADAEELEREQAKLKTWIDWRNIGHTWLGHHETPAPATKFAAFDLDHTLICVKGRWTYPKGPYDWKFLHPSVPKVLCSLHEQEYKIVILTNQNAFMGSKKKPGMPKNAKDFRIKIASIASVLKIPFTVVVATAKDYMRKPCPGMWHIAELDNGGVAVDRSASFFVGDAAGRPAGFVEGAPADFSACDIGLARNAGVPFYTPEDIFHDNNSISLGNDTFVLPPPVEREVNHFTPRLLTSDPSELSGLVDTLKRETQQAQNAERGLLVVLVGPPACGKSTFVNTHLAPLGFERINMDTLKTAKKCENAVSAALEAGRCAVVDNTNPAVETRSAFNDIARKHGAKSIAVVFKHSVRDFAMHNDSFRASIEQACHFRSVQEQNMDHASVLDTIPVGAERIPPVAYHTYYKRLVVPEEAEGFSRVLYHVFIPDFASPDEKKLWFQYF